MKKASFSSRCYKILRRVPRGKVTTYKDLAACLHTRAYRAVGQAMHHNPYAPSVPCHRVVKSDGQIGGFASGVKAKISLLRSEGIPIVNGRIPDLEIYRFRFGSR
jgi:methylated-DNA-[protein]-cysteine S-methyltransferase